MDDYITVEVTVRVKLKADADTQEVVSEMDYNFTHPSILATEVVDVNTEV
jgi:hypothetical protein